MRAAGLFCCGGPRKITKQVICLVRFSSRKDTYHRVAFWSWICLRCLEKVSKNILSNGGLMVINPLVKSKTSPKKQIQAWWRPVVSNELDSLVTLGKKTASASHASEKIPATVWFSWTYLVASSFCSFSRSFYGCWIGLPKLRQSLELVSILKPHWIREHWR